MLTSLQQYGDFQGRVAPPWILPVADNDPQRAGLLSGQSTHGFNLNKGGFAQGGRVVVESSGSQAIVNKVTAPVRFFSKLLEVWNINYLEAACMLLGYEKSGEAHVKSIFAGLARLETRDEKDRISELFAIRKTLLGVFRDRRVENQWLRESQAILGAMSPLDLLLEGSFPNLLRVRQLADLMAGL